MFLVPLLDGTRRLRQRACGVLRQHQHGVVGQIVEERRGGLKEERQVVLDACGGETVADIAVYRHPREISLEARAETAPEIADRVGRKTELARRQQLDPVEPTGGALRLRVETANTVDPPVVQVDAQRRIAAHRENIEQRAADRELSRCTNLWDAGVAGGRQPQSK